MAFWKKKKEEQEKETVLQQDLSKKDETKGLVFTMVLLFEEAVPIPEKEKMTEIFSRISYLRCT